MSEVSTKIDDVLHKNNPKNFWEKKNHIIGEAIKKLKEKFKFIKNSVEEIIENNGRLEFINWMQIINNACPEFTFIEKDFITAMMIGKDNNLKELKFSVF